MFWQTASLEVLKCSHSTLKNKYMYAEFKERAEYVSYGKIIDKISTWGSREKSRASFIGGINNASSVPMNWTNILILKCVCNTFRIIFNEYNKGEKLRTWKRIESTPRHKSEDFLSEI